VQQRIDGCFNVRKRRVFARKASLNFEDERASIPLLPPQKSDEHPNITEKPPLFWLL